MAKILTRNNIQKLLVSKVKRDLKAWRGLAGIWKKKKLISPIKWQRRLRKNGKGKFVSLCLPSIQIFLFIMLLAD